jgi:Ulp1 family protease
LDLDTQDSPSDVSSMPNSPTSDLDSYWIKELGLKTMDKHMNEDGYWLNDRVINAAMVLLINIPLNVGGLQDIIVAKKDGFVHTRNR